MKYEVAEFNEYSRPSCEAKLGRIEKILLVVYISIIVSLGIYFAFSAEAKEVIFSELGRMKDFSLEWFFVLLACGIPLVFIGFPLTILELSVASIIKNFLFAFLLCFCAKCIGTFICFFLGRLLLREKLQVLFSHNKYYQTLQYAVKQHPFKFSLLFKFMLIPHLVKNYSLAISPLPFKYFSMVTVIVTAFYSAIWVYLGINLRGIYEAYNTNKNPSKLFIGTKILMISFSLSVTMYLLYYCSKLYKEFETAHKKETSRIEFKVSKLDDTKYGGCEN